MANENKLDSPIKVQNELAFFRTKFNERIWQALALFCIVNFATNVLRIYSLGVQTFSVPIVVGMSSQVLFLILYRFRKRLSRNAYQYLPVMLGFLISSLGLLATGILGVGVSLILMMNVIVAMLMSRRLLYLSFAFSYALLASAAFAFLSGVLTYPADPLKMLNSPAVWTNTILVVSVLGYVTLTGIADYRRALRDAVRTISIQRDEIATQRDLIHHQATHDALTGLPTLRLARDRLDMACSQASRDKSKAAVLFIDLDGFKAANDSFGHEAGDHVLKVVANRLTNSIRSIDTAARQGGDEFIVIINGADSIDDTKTVADKLVRTIAEPIYYNEQLVKIGSSIGIAVYPDHAASTEETLKHADQAMYVVKKSGKNNYSVYAGPASEKKAE